MGIIVNRYIRSKMAKRTKKVGICGKYAGRYGSAQRKAIHKIEVSQHARYTSPFCGKDSIKRKAAGIWYCKSTKKTIAGGAYQLATAPAITANATIQRLRRLREDTEKE